MERLLNIFSSQRSTSLVRDILRSLLQMSGSIFQGQSWLPHGLRLLIWEERVPLSKNGLAGRPQPTLLLPAICLDPLVDRTVRGGLLKRLLNIFSSQRSTSLVRDILRSRLQIHPKTLIEIAMVLSTNSGSFPSNSHVSATFSILLRWESWNSTNCERFNADGSLMGRTNLDKSVW